MNITITLDKLGDILQVAADETMKALMDTLVETNGPKDLLGTIIACKRQAQIINILISERIGVLKRMMHADPNLTMDALMQAFHDGLEPKMEVALRTQSVKAVAEPEDVIRAATEDTNRFCGFVRDGVARAFADALV